MENKTLNNETKTKRVFTGQVVSTATEKTLIVRVNKIKLHPKYKKGYRVSKKFHVHDEKKVAKVGDLVRFAECRPLSKTKKWRLVAVIKENK